MKFRKIKLKNEQTPKEQLSHDQIKLRLKNMNMYPGFLHNVKKLLTRKVYKIIIYFILTYV